MHQTNSMGQHMVQYTQNIVLEATTSIIVVAQYILLTCDEIHTISNYSWLSIHAYAQCKIGCTYKFFFPLNVWWLHQVLIT